MKVLFGMSRILIKGGPENDDPPLSLECQLSRLAQAAIFHTTHYGAADPVCYIDKSGNYFSKMASIIAI
jgi:hypothetical protein